MMLGLEESLDFAWQAAHVRGADISWISGNSSKPGRDERNTLVVHSTNAWADAHIDEPLPEVRTHMLAQFTEVTGVAVPATAFIDVHRWRFANARRQEPPSYILVPEARLAACGDWFVRGRVEGAFTSAATLLSELPDYL